MFQGNPIGRTPAVKVMVWVNCGLLMVAGLFGFISNIFNFLNLTYPVLALYVCVFGVIASGVELGIGFAVKNVGILTDWFGSALYFIFVGTIGISFVDHSILIFLAGVYSLIVGIGCVIDHCFFTKDGEDLIRPI